MSFSIFRKLEDYIFQEQTKDHKKLKDNMLKYFIYIALCSLLSFDSYAQDITILHVNDSHSYIAPTGSRKDDFSATVGGIARVARIVKTTRESDSTLFLHSGDALVGDIFFNALFDIPEFQLLNDLGLDAMTLGNHEFDLGPYNLQTILSQAFSGKNPFPLLSANCHIPDTSLSLSYLKNIVISNTIKSINGVKIGIFGLTTPSVRLFSNPYPIEFDPDSLLLNRANEQINYLQSQGCKVIILLSHLGIFMDSVIASNTSRINLILGGHDHIKTSTPIAWQNLGGSSTYYVQSKCQYQYISKIKLRISNNDVSLISFNLISLDSNIVEDPSVKVKVEQLQSTVESVFQLNLFTDKVTEATADFEEEALNLTTSGPHDTHIGNLITDAYKWKTNTDVSIAFGGTSSNKLYKGTICPVDIFRVFGYGFNTVNGLGFRLIKFSLKGSDLKSALNYVLRFLPYSDELLPLASGLTYHYDLSRPPDDRLSMIRINGSNIDTSKFYSISGNESFLIALDNIIHLPYKDLYIYQDSSEFQVLLNYIKTLGNTITPYHRESVTDAEVFEQQPNRIMLYQNYPNPFNPSTTIEFNLQDASYLSIDIFNILGEKLKGIEYKFYSAGRHYINFNGTNLPAGVYIYQIRSEGVVIQKKMVLLK